MTRPLIARKDTRADDDAQRRACRARDGSVCRLERLVRGDRSVESPNWPPPALVWKECGKRGALDTVHVYPRRDCAKASTHVDVVLNGCRECHDRYDGRTLDGPEVRVPPAREERAWVRILSMSKVAPVRRRPPELAT